MLHYQTIDSPTLELLKALMNIPEFGQLCLVGGTALALQIGHRKSIDLDLFGKIDLDEYHYSTILNPFGTVIQLNSSRNIKGYLINKIKVDIVNYPYPWLGSCIHTEGIRLAGMADIAAMKLAAITGRGTKKDFIDLFSLLSYYSLEEMIGFYRHKYHDGSEFMVVKSLSYFEDAETEQEPVLLSTIAWENVKSTILRETKKYINSR